MRLHRLSVPLLLLLASLGCSDDPAGTSGSGPDTSGGEEPDAAADAAVDPDAAAEPDVAPDAGDPGPADVAPDTGAEPLTGLGVLSGECGVLDDDEWGAATPFLFRNAVDLGALGWDEDLLTEEGREVFEAGNLGGSSIHSEVLSFEVLQRCEGAELLKTEAEVLYSDVGGKKTDLLVSIDGRKVGVSVTRAFHFPPGTPYTEEDALHLLERKLSDIPLSAANAAPEDAWVRSMLAVIAYDGQHADLVRTVWEGLDADVRAETIVLVTVTDGEDAFVY